MAQERRDPRIPADFDFNRKNWLDQITMHPDLEGGSIDFDGVRLISRRTGDEIEVVGPHGDLRKKSDQ